MRPGTAIRRNNAAYTCRNHYIVWSFSSFCYIKTIYMGTWLTHGDLDSMGTKGCYIDSISGSRSHLQGRSPYIAYTINTTKIPCLPGIVINCKKHGVCTAAFAPSTHPDIIYTGLSKIDLILFHFIPWSTSSIAIIPADQHLPTIGRRRVSHGKFIGRSRATVQIV